MRPIIAVTARFEAKLEGLCIQHNYYEALTTCGSLPIMLPLTDDADEIARLLDGVDGVLLPGGLDIDAHCYGEEPRPTTESPYLPLDRHQMALVPQVLARDLPMLGICRGMQAINVALGGTLWQDLCSQRACTHDHRVEKDTDRPAHTVDVVSGTPLAELLDMGEMGVNSIHHQAVRKLGRGLEPMAYSDDGVVEAVWMPKRRFVRAVQWHPEQMWHADQRQRAIIQQFVDACRG